MAWLSDWENRRKITLSNTNVDAVLSDFPILIKLSASSGTGSTDITDIFTELAADANRKRIAITTSDGTTQCYVEIERFDFANSLAWLWVKVPSVAAASVTELYIYYDIAQAENTTYVGDTTEAVTHNVWDANFKGVWHMAQDPDGDAADAIKDSTSNANHGTPAGSMTSADLVDGKIGKAIDFDGSNDELDLGQNVFSAVQGTVECIIKFVDLAQTQTFFSTSNVASSTNYLKMEIDSADGKFRFQHTSINSVKGDTVLSQGTIYGITAVSDGTAWTLYVDNTLQSLSVTGSNTGDWFADLPSGTYDNWIGRWERLTSSRSFDGIIDEVRISNIARSAAWIKATCYSNWDELIGFGAAEEFLKGELSENVSVSSGFDTNRADIDENITVNSEFLCLDVSSPISEDASVSSNLIAEHTGNLSENASVNAELISEHTAELSEEATVNSAFAVARHLIITDTLSSWDTLKWSWHKSVADSLDIAETIETIVGITVKEWLALTDIETNNWTGTEVVTDSVYAVDFSKVIQVYVDLIADGMAATDAVGLALELIATDIITCTDTVLDAGTFQHLIEDGVALEDIARRCFPKSISDSFAATDTSLLGLLVLLQIADSFDAADTATRLVTINQSIADSLDALDTVAIQQLIYELIQDGLSIEVVVELDGEVWECWVVNTSDFHISVYSGYDFNSFAILNDTVYGCKSDGIYELSGADDDGTAFKAGIILPATQFNSPKNKRFRKAYFGVSGDNLLMKLDTDNGCRTFRMIDTEMSLTRDLKGRKWKISLESFDSLDFVELTPVILSKK